MRRRPRQRPFPYLRGNILILTITQTFGQLGRSMVFPYASLYILALGGSPEKVGVVNSLMPVLGLLVLPLAGQLTDITGRVRLIASAGAFSALIYVGYAAAPNWRILAALSLLQGLAVMQFPPSAALIADSLAPTDRVKGAATMNAIAGLVSVAAPYLGGMAIDRLGTESGLRLLYGLLAALYLLDAGVNARFLRETSTSRRHITWRETWNLLRDSYLGVPALVRSLSPTLRAIGGVATLGFVANALVGPFWVVYAVQRMGLSSSQWGLALLVEAALLNLAYMLAAVLTDRLGRARTMSGALILSLLAMLLFVWVRGFTALLVVRVLVAVGNAFFMPACGALLADSIPRETRGRVMAALGRGMVMIGTSAGGTGGPGLGFLITPFVMLASLLAGYLYAANPRLPWFVASLAVLIALWLAVRHIRDPHHAEI